MKSRNIFGKESYSALMCQGLFSHPKFGSVDDCVRYKIWLRLIGVTVFFFLLVPLLNFGKHVNGAAVNFAENILDNKESHKEIEQLLEKNGIDKIAFKKMLTETDTFDSVITELIWKSVCKQIVKGHQKKGGENADDFPDLLMKKDKTGKNRFTCNRPSNNEVKEVLRELFDLNDDFFVEYKKSSITLAANLSQFQHNFKDANGLNFPTIAKDLEKYAKNEKNAIGSVLRCNTHIGSNHAQISSNWVRIEGASNSKGSYYWRMDYGVYKLKPSGENREQGDYNIGTLFQVGFLNGGYGGDVSNMFITGNSDQILGYSSVSSLKSSLKTKADIYQRTSYYDLSDPDSRINAPYTGSKLARMSLIAMKDLTGLLLLETPSELDYVCKVLGITK